MLLQNLRARVGARIKGDRESGFTLIELLVVMLILGILAAIALPAFFNQKDKAGDSKAKEYAHSAQVAMETYATDNGGSYVDAGKDSNAALIKIEPTLSSADITVSAATTDGYTLVSEAPDTGNTFTIKNEKGTLTFSCLAKGEGGCPADGFWD
jgi:type IV pilus assembly protein PilA